jgi:hypothetical protein
VAGTHTLSGDVKTLIGTEDFTRLRARVEILGSGRATDPDTGETRLGGIDVITADSNSTVFAVELPDPTWDPSPWYRLVVDYNALTSNTKVPTWTSGEFQMDVDRTLADLPVEAPVAFDPATYENIETFAEQAEQAAAVATTAVAAARVASSVTYSGGLPATETIPLATGGNLVKTYHWDDEGNPTTCDWNYPTGPDYVETFTYDADGNATGSTFAEA